MLFADVAELADALDLGSSVTDVGVQVPSSAPIKAITSVIAFFYFILNCQVKCNDISK